MNRMLLGVITLATFVVAFPLVAAAQCRVDWDCSSGYPCRQVQICSHTFDIPAIPQPAISPIPPAFDSADSTGCHSANRDLPMPSGVSV
jgi:hypothetical protein